MKRITLLGILMAAFLAPAGAHAATPCRDKIYNEWYSTGKISTSYPLSCYRDALKHIPPDAQVYSNLGGDIKAAMQAAVAHHDNGGGPSAVGSGPAPASGPQGVKGSSTTTTNTNGPAAIAPLSSSHGGGVPTPIIVLGVIAILLALAGLAGTGVQQLRKRQRPTG